ncbi:cellulose biosynthesis protein BcsS [Methylorubrum populi]
MSTGRAASRWRGPASAAGPAARRRDRRCPAIVLAASLTASSAYGPARGEDFALRTVLFGSLDAGASVFSTSGAKIAFDRFERDGPVALVSAGGGFRLEGGAGAPLRMRTTTLGAALGGYQFIRDWGAVTVFAGPEISWEMLAGPGGEGALPVRMGLRLHGEIWARPSQDTLTTATAIVGSARGDAYARLSWGYSLFGAYLGPEIALYGDRTDYRKWNIGLHATDYTLGGYRLRLSAGCQIETPRDRLGPYLSLALWSAL